MCGWAQTVPQTRPFNQHSAAWAPSRFGPTFARAFRVFVNRVRGRHRGIAHAIIGGAARRQKRSDVAVLFAACARVQLLANGAHVARDMVKLITSGSADQQQREPEQCERVHMQVL
jgi:hypothetical protein